MTMLVGIGVPSKYFTFPVSLSDRAAAVTLKPREPADAADDEERQHDHVPPAAQPEGETENRRGDSERDDVRQRIQVGAEHGLTLPVQARDVAVEDVEDQCERQQKKSRPQESTVVGCEVVEAQEDRDAFRTQHCRSSAHRPRCRTGSIDMWRRGGVVVTVTLVSRCAGERHGSDRCAGRAPAEARCPWPRDRSERRPASVRFPGSDVGFSTRTTGVPDDDERDWSGRRRVLRSGDFQLDVDGRPEDAGKKKTRPAGRQRQARRSGAVGAPFGTKKGRRLRRVEPDVGLVHGRRNLRGRVHFEVVARVAAERG